jgi:7-carboxy-7-deazaguanine synthase
MIYPINEIFVTIQGEGAYSGTPSIFIRIQGCDVGCPWCDTRHTWELNQKITFDSMLDKVENSPQYADATLDDLYQYLKNSHIKHVVITGGEPAIYNLIPLGEIIIKLGKTVQIETSGTYPLQITDNIWVTLSPKIDMPGGRKVLSSSLLRANEIKMPVGKIDDIEKLKQLFLKHDLTNKKVFLQPLSTNKSATKLCIAQALENNWNLSVQIHKYLDIR